MHISISTCTWISIKYQREMQSWIMVMDTAVRCTLLYSATVLYKRNVLQAYALRVRGYRS